MTIPSDMPVLVSAAKATLKPVLTAIMASLWFASFSANATSEVTISQPASGSTTIVEQSADGKVATITATPTGITMQDGVPFYVTQVTNVPRYSYSKANVTQVSLPEGTTTVTTLPVTTMPVTTMPVTATVPATASTAVISLDTLQLNPVFSVPNQVNANTKIMKVLKNSAGRDVAVPANHIAAGDIIEYHTTYSSSTSVPVTDLNATVALPNGVKLVSLNSPLPTLATTGGDSYQTIQQVGNTVVVQENYSGLKWNLVNLAADAPQTVIIRAKVQ